MDTSKWYVENVEPIVLEKMKGMVTKIKEGEKSNLQKIETLEEHKKILEGEIQKYQTQIVETERNKFNIQVELNKYKKLENEGYSMMKEPIIKEKIIDKESEKSIEKEEKHDIRNDEENNKIIEQTNTNEELAVKPDENTEINTESNHTSPNNSIFSDEQLSELDNLNNKREEKQIEENTKIIHEYHKENEEDSIKVENKLVTSKESIPEKNEVVKPRSKETVNERPEIVEPVFEEPVLEEPMLEEPMFEEPVFEEPVFEEPVFKKPVFEERVF